MSTSEAVTEGIRVEVRAEFVPEQSNPDRRQWYFAYNIRISNESARTVQLISRHWIITDANGRVEHVKGPGVIGRQPVIRPGESHEYTSFCPLETSFGTMSGSYRMQDEEGTTFDVAIGTFTLNTPYSIN